MPGKIIFKIRGAREMENLLKALGPRVARRVGNNALRAAAKPIVTEAKRLAPVRSGRLRNSIRAVLSGVGDAKDALLIRIGVVGREARLAHLIEFGHVSKNQFGGSYGFVAASPFLRPAMDARARQALWEMGRVLAKGIDDQARALDKGRR